MNLRGGTNFSCFLKPPKLTKLAPFYIKVYTLPENRTQNSST